MNIIMNIEEVLQQMGKNPWWGYVIWLIIMGLVVYGLITG